MKSERPTVRCVIEKSKKRKDGLFPLYILVTWKFKRAKEATGVYMTEKDFKKGAYKSNRGITKRIRELEYMVDDLLSEGREFTPREVLASTTMTTFRIISEMCRVKRLAVRTCEGYMTTHRSLQSYFGEDYTLSSLTLPMVQGYARTMRVSPSAMAFYLKDLKSLLGYAKERGYVKENVMEKWRFKGDGYKDMDKPRSRSMEEIRGYVRLWRKTREEALGIWLAGFYYNGLALVDLVSVDWDKVEEEFIGGSWYYSFTVERRKTREVAHVMTPVTELTKDLLSFLRTRPWGRRSSYSSYINNRLKKIDKSLTYYQCRHSFASLLVGSRTPLNTIASMLGRSVNGLSTYIHRVTESETLAEASRALIDEEIEVSPEDEMEVFEDFIK